MMWRLSGSIANGGGVLAAQAMGADLAYDSSEIVYFSLFTGVNGNYLRQSIRDAGLDPDNLPEGDPTKMDFGSGGNTNAKAWKDIWGCGQGIGAVKSIGLAGYFVARLQAEYYAAKVRVQDGAGAGDRHALHDRSLICGRVLGERD